VEVFGEQDAVWIKFTHEGKDYLVDDQYCMKPSCKCNYAIFTFIDCSLNSKTPGIKCDPTWLEERKMNLATEKEIHSIVDYIIRENKSDLATLRNRYLEMKEKGSTLLAQERNANVLMLKE
jgi:hypothetical protein